MVPTLVASHVVTSNWQPRTAGSLSDPAGSDPSKSSAALWENKFEVHPDTPRDDPVFRLLGATPRPLTPR
jgi:P-type Ca2+ transporter type 2C